MAEYGLGRLVAPDARDHRFLLGRPLAVSERPYRYWYDNVWWGDQGENPFCVGYAWAHFIEDAPTMHFDFRSTPFVHPETIYHEAQQLDEWDGVGYEGTSVRAGAKYLQRLGVIGEYRWAFDADTVAENVLEVGPVVVGTDWYQRMTTPDSNGVLRLDGPIVGGHAYVINGYSRAARRFRIKNSWSRSWGQRGNAWLAYDDLATLLASNGEACLAMEVQR